ncbi:MAG: DUF1810 domain-containing protein [Methylococcaceae bacterium]|nr:DUF1810 domain-containing protein [Methylococcaceae bacterium]
MNSKEFDLTRFIEAQADSYATALSELKSGQKHSHWMWYIFPQLDGLGHSEIAKYYAIKSLAEAQQYLNHPVLGKRLLECTAAVLAVEGRTILDIMGFPDNLKLNSSMTLFAHIANSNPVFIAVIDKYFAGKQDVKTLQLLASRID